MIPNGWDVTDIAVVGTHGLNNYQLVLAVVEDGDSTVRAVGFDAELLTGRDRSHDPLALADAPVISPAGMMWTLPSRLAGRLAVVEQRSDGWHLVADAGGMARDLVRSSHPIVGYAIDSAVHHIVIAVDGPDGITNWWIHGQHVERLNSNATALAWWGTHNPTEPDS